MTVRTDEDALSEGYRVKIERALDAAFEREKKEAEDPIISLDLSSDRYIIFSDLHRGARNGADDFLNNERAYNAALAYYFKMGHTLVILGDVEELWEEKPVSVLRAYKHALYLEAQFHRQERCLRIWGNHDDEWQYEDRVKRLLSKLYGGPELKVRESLRIKVVDGTDELGSLFLVHGHQGDTTSDRFSWASRLFARYVWRPFQRITHFSLNTPAKHWRLRDRHNKAMYYWAEKQDKLVLIAGHTHRPVFKSESHEAQIKKVLEGLEKKTRGMLSNQQLEAQAVLLAKLEWVMAQENQIPGIESDVPMTKPCYFNTGCCCFLDGDITGIEIADGEIRLVRWPDEENEPRPHILVKDSLRDVLAAC